MLFIDNGNKTGCFVGEWVVDKTVKLSHLITSKRPRDPEDGRGGVTVAFACGKETNERAYKAPWYPKCQECVAASPVPVKEQDTWAG